MASAESVHHSVTNVTDLVLRLTFAAKFWVIQVEEPAPTGI